MNRVSAFYGIVMGAGLLGTWLVLFARGVPPDFQTTPLESWFLLLAEVLTGVALLLGGYGILTNHDWGPPLHWLSLGMMLYTCVMSIGVFAQAGNVPATIWFVLTSVATLALAINYLVREAHAPNKPGHVTRIGERSPT